MVRSTSLEAYEKVQSSGVLADRQREAYNTLYQHGPLTGQELNEKMTGDGAWKLCAPLKELGLIIEVSKGTCKVTGNTAYLWDVTDKAPPETKVVRVSTIQQLNQFKILMSQMNDALNLDIPIESNSDFHGSIKFLLGQSETK